MRTRSRAIALLALLVGLAGLSGCGFKDPAEDGPATNGQGFTLLDAPGVAHIEKTHRARFDLRQRSITRKAVGLEAGRLGPIVGGASDPELRLELVAPERTEKVRTSTFSVAFTSKEDRADMVTWFEAYDTDAAGQEALERAVGRWGLHEDRPSAWRKASDAGLEKITLGEGVAPSGLVTSVTVRRNKSGGQTHQWMILLSPELYTPKSLEQIRRTGRAPLG